MRSVTLAKAGGISGRTATICPLSFCGIWVLLKKVARLFPNASSRQAVDPKDQESWYREWNKMAVANHERGNAALSSGNFLTDQSRLRALSYYNVAVFNFDFADKR